LIQTSVMSQAMPLGIVVRRSPGATRWARWCWTATAVLPGAGQADWRVLTRDGEITEYHAATPDLTLYRTDTEAYLTGLSARVPCIYVVMRRPVEEADPPLDVLMVTASPYEAQDYLDSGEEIVEKVPMPPGLIAWVRAFVEEHHVHEEFKKRRRDKTDIGQKEDGIGDPRISQVSDVYRSPALLRQSKTERMH